MIAGFELLSTELNQADLAGEDEITLAGVTLCADGIGTSVRSILRSQVAAILAKHGRRAFDCPKLSAAIHEAGHVAHVATGGRVKEAHIDLHASGAWIGYTAHRNGTWHILPQDATVAKWLNVARDLQAGVAAEMLFDPDFRQGSSLDEILMSQYAAAQAAQLNSEDPERLWATEVHHWLGNMLRENRDVHSKITAHLMKRGRLKGLALSEMCRKIKRRA